jgi:hypothetical protein
MNFAVLGLLLFFGLGAPVALWLPRGFNDRWSAAPVFGLAIFGLVATLAYFNDLLVQATIALAAIASTSLVACCIMVRDRAWLIALIGYGLLICVVCVAPMWIGGFKFAIFQANPDDQLNYISMASAYSTQSYSSIVATGAASDFISTRASVSLALARPTVTIVLAAIRPWLYATTAEAAPAFQALLQVFCQSSGCYRICGWVFPAVRIRHQRLEFSLILELCSRRRRPRLFHSGERRRLCVRRASCYRADWNLLLLPGIVGRLRSLVRSCVALGSRAFEAPN